MINDRYELLEPLGSGGMATVWRARDLVLERLVAIKRLPSHLSDDSVAGERFHREAQAAARLTHRGIVTVYDTGIDEDGPYIVFELIDGETLADRIAREGRMEPGPVALIVSEAADALDHAHAHGVVHRDIKPSNLMIDANGNVKVADFGIARVVGEATTLTVEGELVGTLTYMAPEVVDGQPATPAADIYSLGAVTHQMLSGEPPFRGDNVGALVAAIRAGETTPIGEVDPAIAAAVAKAMSADPDARPLTAGAFATALIGGTTMPLAGGFVVPAGVGSNEPTRVINALPDEPKTRSPWRAMMITAVVAIAALLVLAAALNTIDQPDAAAGTTVPTTAVAAVTSTTDAATTTFLSTTTTTTIPTTTTTPTTTTDLADTPEEIADEIETMLAGLHPSEFHPPDVRRVERGLDKVMEAWFEGNEEKIAESFEDELFDAVENLDDSPERDQIIDGVIRLAESMGFEVRSVDENVDDD